MRAAEYRINIRQIERTNTIRYFIVFEPGRLWCSLTVSTPRGTMLWPRCDDPYPRNALLTTQQLLADRYRLVSYHRRGFAGSESYKTDLPPTISRQASECQALMDYLQVRSAHLVGHSHGGVIALQLALLLRFKCMTFCRFYL